MMVEDKKDIRPALVKFGFALALSFAGFLLSRLKIKRDKSFLPPRSPRSSDHSTEVDIAGERPQCRDDLHVKNRTSSSGSITSVSAERYEDSYLLKVAVDNSRVFPPSCRNSGEKDGYLLPEFNDLVKEFDFITTNSGTSDEKNGTPRSDVKTLKSFKGLEEVDDEQEIRRLRYLVSMLRERERNLEAQMLEFYGLKEQESAMMEMQNRLKIKNMEAKLSALKIESLQVNNKRLHEKLADQAEVVAELDAARGKIKLLKKKLWSEAEQNKEQIFSLQKRVSRLQEQELNAAATDSEIKLKLQRLKDLETEAEDLRKSNSKLHLENSEMVSRLGSMQNLANSLEDQETEALRKLGNRLRQENEDLMKKVEQLQADRCSDIEELVYLRWVNACLRYELRNFQPQHGKIVARDLSKSLSPRSEEKAKQLILEYANTEGVAENGFNIMDLEPDHWSSSQASYNTDSGEVDDSLSSKTNHSGKTKVFHKLRGLLLGKETHQNNHRLPAHGTRGMGDSYSPNGSLSFSTVTDATSDHSIRGQTPLNSSRRSSGHSIYIQRFRSLKMDDVKDMEDSWRKSEAGSSHGHRRFSSGGASDLSLEHLTDKDLYSIEKLELTKFAEVLKESGSRAGNGNRIKNFHRKSASVGSFEAFHRSPSE